MNARELKNHISGVDETVKITRAMQMIAASKFYRAREKCQNSYRYFKSLRTIFSAIAHKKSVKEHPLLIPRETGKTALFVVAGDKGLCGDFNHRLLSFADQFIETNKVSKIFAIGQESREHYEKKGIPMSNFYIHMAQEPHAFDAISVTNDMLEMFKSGEYKQVSIVYTRTPAPSVQEPAVKTLLPISLPDPGTKSDGDEYGSETSMKDGDCIFEPDSIEAVTSFLSQYIMAEIYSALADSAMAIHYKRMTSMSQSTDNGTALIAELTARYNHQRQEGITSELTNANASALRGE